MIAIRLATAVMTLAAALALPAIAQAEDPAPVAEPPASTQSETPPVSPPVIGRGMGPMAAERCRMHKPGMTGMRQPCPLHGDAQGDKRIEMLEKRLDAMQLTLEMLVRERAAGVSP